MPAEAAVLKDSNRPVVAAAGMAVAAIGAAGRRGSKARSSVVVGFTRLYFCAARKVAALKPSNFLQTVVAEACSCCRVGFAGTNLVEASIAAALAS